MIEVHKFLAENTLSIHSLLDVGRFTSTLNTWSPVQLWVGHGDPFIAGARQCDVHVAGQHLANAFPSRRGLIYEYT